MSEKSRKEGYHVNRLACFPSVQDMRFGSRFLKAIHVELRSRAELAQRRALRRSRRRGPEAFMREDPAFFFPGSQQRPFGPVLPNTGLRKMPAAPDRAVPLSDTESSSGVVCQKGQAVGAPVRGGRAEQNEQQSMFENAHIAGGGPRSDPHRANLWRSIPGRGGHAAAGRTRRGR